MAGMRAIKTGYKPVPKKHVKFIFPLKGRKSAVLLFPYSPCFRSSIKSFKKLNLDWLFHHVYSVNTALDHVVVVVVFFFPFVTKKMLFVLKTVTGLPSSLF